jgi:predicted ATPase with chaperone activity
MLARQLTPILPDMTVAEAAETTRMHRVAGLTGDRRAFVTTCTNHLRGDHTRALSESG